jgi:hypothetical protein
MELYHFYRRTRKWCPGAIFKLCNILGQRIGGSETERQHFSNLEPEPHEIDAAPQHCLIADIN